MQNTLVLEAMEFRRPCGLEYQSKHEFKNITTTVSCYRGAVFPLRWKDTDTRKSDLKIMKENKKVMGGIENYRSLRNKWTFLTSLCRVYRSTLGEVPATTSSTRLSCCSV